MRNYVIAQKAVKIDNLFSLLLYLEIGFKTYIYNFCLFVYNNLFFVLKILIKIPQKLLILIINLFVTFIRMFYNICKLIKETLYISIRRLYLSVKPFESLIKFIYVSLSTFFTKIKQKVYNIVVNGFALLVKFNIKIIIVIFKYIINPIYKLTEAKNLNKNNIVKQTIQGSFAELSFSATITKLNIKIIYIIKYNFTQSLISLNILLKAIFIRFKELNVILYFNRKNLLKKIIYFMLKQKWYLNAYIYIIKEIIIKDILMLYNKFKIPVLLFQITLKKINLIGIFNGLIQLDISDIIAKKIIVYVYKTVVFVKNIIIKPQYFVNKTFTFTIHTINNFVQAFSQLFVQITPILFLELIPVTFYNFVEIINIRLVYILSRLNKHLKIFKLDLIFSLIINLIALFIRSSNLIIKLFIKTIYKICKNTILVIIKISCKIFYIVINVYKNVINILLKTFNTIVKFLNMLLNTPNRLFELCGFLYKKAQNKIYETMEKPIHALSNIFYTNKKTSYKILSDIHYILKRLRYKLYTLIYGLIYRISYTLLYTSSYISYAFKIIKITILDTLLYISNKYKTIVYSLNRFNYIFKCKFNILLEKILFVFKKLTFKLKKMLIVVEKLVWRLKTMLFTIRELGYKLKNIIFIFREITIELTNKSKNKLTNKSTVKLTNKLNILNVFKKLAIELLCKFKYKLHTVLKVYSKLYNKIVLYTMYTLDIFKQPASKLTAIFKKANSMLSIKSIYKFSKLIVKSGYRLVKSGYNLNYTLYYDLLKILQNLIYTLGFGLGFDLLNLLKVLLITLKLLFYDIGRLIAKLPQLLTLHNYILYRIKERLEKTEEGRTFKLAMFQIFKVDFQYYTLYRGWFGRWFWRWFWRTDEKVYRNGVYIYKKTIDIAQVLFIFIKQLFPYLHKRIIYGINIIITSILKPGYYTLKSIPAGLKIIFNLISYRLKSVSYTLKLIPVKLGIILNSIYYALKSITLKIINKSKTTILKSSNILKLIYYTLKSITFKISNISKSIISKLGDISKLIIFKSGDMLKSITVKINNIPKEIVFKLEYALKLIYALNLILYILTGILGDILKAINTKLKTTGKLISYRLKFIYFRLKLKLELVSFNLKSILRAMLKLIYYALKATPAKLKSIYRFIMILDYIVLEYINSAYQNAHYKLKGWKNMRKIKRNHKLQRLEKIKETHTVQKEILQLNLQTKLQKISEIKLYETLGETAKNDGELKEELKQINTINEEIQKIVFIKKNNNSINNDKNHRNITLNDLYIKPSMLGNSIIKNVKNNIDIIYNTTKKEIDSILNSITEITELSKNIKKKFHETRLELTTTKNNTIEIDYNNIYNSNYKQNINEIVRRINYTTENIYKDYLYEYFNFFNIIKYSYYITKNKANHICNYLKISINYYKKQIKNISIKNLQKLFVLFYNKVTEIGNTYIKNTITICILIANLKENFRFLLKKINKIKVIPLFKKNNIVYKKPKKSNNYHGFTLISSLVNLLIKIAINLKQDLCIKINNYINFLDITLNIIGKFFEFIKYLEYISKTIYKKNNFTLILTFIINSSLKKLGYIFYKINKVYSKTERDISLEFYTLATLDKEQTITDKFTIRLYKIRQWLIKILNLKFVNEPEIKTSPLKLTKLPLMTLFNGPFKYPFYKNVKKYALETQTSFISETSLTSKLLFWYQNNIKLKKPKLSFTPIVFDKKNEIEFKKFERSLHYWKKYKDKDYNIYFSGIIKKKKNDLPPPIKKMDNLRKLYIPYLEGIIRETIKPQLAKIREDNKAINIDSAYKYPLIKLFTQEQPFKRFGSRRWFKFKGLNYYRFIYRKPKYYKEDNPDFVRPQNKKQRRAFYKKHAKQLYITTSREFIESYIYNQMIATKNTYLLSDEHLMYGLGDDYKNMEFWRNKSRIRFFQDKKVDWNYIAVRWQLRHVLKPLYYPRLSLFTVGFSYIFHLRYLNIFKEYLEIDHPKWAHEEKMLFLQTFPGRFESKFYQSAYDAFSKMKFIKWRRILPKLEKHQAKKYKETVNEHKESFATFYYEIPWVNYAVSLVYLPTTRKFFKNFPTFRYKTTRFTLYELIKQECYATYISVLIHSFNTFTFFKVIYLNNLPRYFVTHLKYIDAYVKYYTSYTYVKSGLLLPLRTAYYYFTDSKLYYTINFFRRKLVAYIRALIYVKIYNFTNNINSLIKGIVLFLWNLNKFILINTWYSIKSLTVNLIKNIINHPLKTIEYIMSGIIIPLAKLTVILIYDTMISIFYTISYLLENLLHNLKNMIYIIRYISYNSYLTICSVLSKYIDNYIQDTNYTGQFIVNNIKRSIREFFSRKNPLIYFSLGLLYIIKKTMLEITKVVLIDLIRPLLQLNFVSPKWRKFMILDLAPIIKRVIMFFGKK